MRGTPSARSVGRPTLGPMASVYVAAGGGGDALAAAILHRALRGRDPATILTYAWDRLSVDPLPGPRAVGDFDDLRPLDGGNFAFTADTKPRPPSGSTLPRLAAELPDTLVLLDPTGGAVGMRQQVARLVESVGANAVTVVDVGGDAIARGDEPGLRSPLADALSLAACTDLPVPVTVLVAGPGLDGELSEAQVLDAVDRPPAFRLRPDDIEPFRQILDWHPSEATALLAAAAIGLRGRVEIRDAGLVVPLTDTSATVYALPLDDALALNKLAAAISATTSLDDAEQVTRDTCGFSEIDYERTEGTAHRHASRPTTITADDRRRDPPARARRRHTGTSTSLTFRRLAEAVRLGPKAASDLRRTSPRHAQATTTGHCGPSSRFPPELPRGRTGLQCCAVQHTVDSSVPGHGRRSA